MTTTTKDEITVSSGTVAPVAPPDDVREKAGTTGEDLLSRFRASMESRLDRRQAALRGGGAELGEPTVGPYVAFDLYAFTPIQFGGPPPYQPSKIIAGGEWAVIYAVMFVNPTIDIVNGFAVPPTVQLSGRRWRVSMDQINLTNVTDGPDDFRQDRFSSPAPPFTLLEFWFQAAYPGRKPALFEANLSADILNFGQPYAAFASTIVDADTGRVQENIPLRYLVYPK
ncbi:hypothetical protein OWR29_22925 [Actinoplanes sp. Pm04-4]|uniref:Uncharacterized protein n=1 Tax=Paractinoplanes pyxinae TaxID=2997416 RepID=A0ABT4B490_9ACTN|nr:hypothetical protein [Actinoplanes pyxinae]MCY1140862.1 hypothetical protein [Actinoplanes pyxinae]